METPEEIDRLKEQMRKHFAEGVGPPSHEEYHQQMECNRPHGVKPTPYRAFPMPPRIRMTPAQEKVRGCLCITTKWLLV